MAQREKLIAKLCARPPEARFSDVRAILEAFGWTRDRQSGSHVTFVKPGEFPITVPIHAGKVRRVYLDEVCGRLELDCER